MKVLKLPDNSEKENARQLWLNQQTHYDEAKALELYRKHQAVECERRRKEELQRQLREAEDKKKQEAQFKKTIDGLFTAVDPDGQILGLDYKFEDNADGVTLHQSPTIREILYETLSGWSDDSLLLTNPQLLAEQMAERLNGHEYSFTFDRSEYVEKEELREHTHDWKFVTYTFLLRSKMFPIKL